jgi:hypothetical protein
MSSLQAFVVAEALNDAFETLSGTADRPISCGGKRKTASQAFVFP